MLARWMSDILSKFDRLFTCKSKKERKREAMNVWTSLVGSVYMQGLSGWVGGRKKVANYEDDSQRRIMA